MRRSCWRTGEAKAMLSSALGLLSRRAVGGTAGALVAFTVILSARDDLLRISVRDASPLHGAELRPAPLHGLGAVDAMAIRWGVESLGRAGKTVWVDLPR